MPGHVFGARISLTEELQHAAVGSLFNRVYIFGHYSGMQGRIRFSFFPNESWWADASDGDKACDRDRVCDLARK